MISLGISSELKIEHQKIDDERAEALAQSLITHTALKKLKLVEVEMGDKAALTIANALATQPTIKTFLLISPQGTQEGGSQLVEAVRMNRFLTLIHLNTPGLSPAHKTIIDETMQRNRAQGHSLFELLFHHCITKESPNTHRYD